MHKIVKMLNSFMFVVAIIASVVISTFSIRAEPFDPWAHIGPGIRHTINLLISYQMRVLGYEGLAGVPVIDRSDYTALHDRYFCFLNLTIPRSEKEFDRIMAEFGELIQAGRGPCEGYIRDGGAFVDGYGEVRFRGYSRTPTPPLQARSSER